jgi:hypothetical protein
MTSPRLQLASLCLPVALMLLAGRAPLLAQASLGASEAQEAPVPAAEPAQLAALSAEYLQAHGQQRRELAGALRKAGAAGGRALLARLGQAGWSHASFELALELLPASATPELLQLLPSLDQGGRARALEWLARRDVPGVREVAAARIAALLHFVDERGALALVAAEKLGEWDQEQTARELARRLQEALEQGGRFSPQLRRRLARSFADLEASKRHVGALVSLAAERDPTLLPSLLRALGRRADLVLAGALDPWIEAQAPGLRQAANLAFSQADLELYVNLRHAERVTMLRRFRERSLRPVPWALAEAHAALFGLADPSLAEPALRVLDRSTARSEQRAEAYSMRAISALLAGEDPRAAIERAESESGRGFSRAQREARVSFGDETPVDFLLFKEWRQQLPPELGEHEYEQRLARLRRRGGPVYDRLRVAGRRHLSTQLLASTLLHFSGHEAEAQSALDRAAHTWSEIDFEWNEELAGPNRELDEALQLRSGVVQLFDRALEGNERAFERVDEQERKRRLGLAERGYRHLIDGLHARLEGRVMEGPWSKSSPEAGAFREYVYSDITGQFASYYERIGEEDKAIAIYDHMIERLKEAGESRNRFLWASALFSRASIAMDQRDAETSRRCLDRYLEHYDSRYRDVVQNPDRYFDADAARAWFGGRLAAGYVSMAVLHNVVLHETDTARTFIERAYTLEDSVFNRVLYACYLARDERKDEALALLEVVEPRPSLYYNLACTYALCGLADKALEFLELDLNENHPTRKSRNRQRDWARGDRDLESLREDPRFVELVRPRAEGEGR